MKGGEIELTETKSGEREKVTLNLEVIELLKQIAKERKIDLDSMIDEQKNEYVFTGMKGQRLFSVKKADDTNSQKRRNRTEAFPYFPSLLDNRDV